MGRSSEKGTGKKLLLFVMLAAVIALAAYFLINAKKEAENDAAYAMSTNAERVEFLNKQGWIVKPDPMSQEEILIPAEFNDVYKEYQALQKSQGFDLEKYKGMPVELISYRVLNYPGYTENITANMLISDGRLIGGDITLNEENGFTKPLVKVISEPEASETAAETTVTTVTEAASETVTAETSVTEQTACVN